MSKSYGNAVNLGDGPEEMRRTVSEMLTDPARKRRKDAGNPYICPVYHNHKIFSQEGDVAQILDGCRAASLGCVECKKRLADSLEESLAPLVERRAEWLRTPERIREILTEGARRARVAAEETMALVRERMGIDYGGSVPRS
jgi:tryptophanyl-tRNA synthetase